MSSIVKIPQNMIEKLDGRLVSEDEAKILTKRLDQDPLPDWFVNLIQRYKVTGVMFRLSKLNDKSNLGVDMKWKEPFKIIDELFEHYPGIGVIGMGYLPIGSCMGGSGDPYFVKMSENSSDSKLVRIIHDLLQDDDTYLEEEFEVVSDNLEDFFNLAEIEK